MAADFEVLCVAGTESELDWGYSGLRRMLQPVLGRVEAMRHPHADVLRAALGYVGGPPMENQARFAAGLGALNVLSEIATTRPVLCVVDDVQWLDNESREALTLVGPSNPGRRNRGPAGEPDLPASVSRECRP